MAGPGGGGKAVTRADEGEEPTNVDVAAPDVTITWSTPTATRIVFTRVMPAATGTSAEEVALGNRNKQKGRRRLAGKGHKGSITPVMVAVAERATFSTASSSWTCSRRTRWSTSYASAGAGIEGEVLHMERHPQFRCWRSLLVLVISSKGRYVLRLP